AHQLDQLALRDAGQQRGIGDLVAIEVEDRQHCSIPSRVEELVRVPAGCEWSGLSFAVAHDAEHRQLRVIESSPIRMDQRVTELAALVDRARRLGRVVTRDSARKRKLPEQLAYPGLIQRHLG